MKKVININFQGRVVPIEETAYDLLKQYIESLRNFFANEEGKEEIINDIESRVAELFAEILKKGSTCITDDDVNKVIASMGRPEDFESEEEKIKTNLKGNTTQQHFEGNSTRRLYRDENHKVLGGVCSGIANYFGIERIIIRILALVTFGVVFVPYLVLWVAVPSSATQIIGSTRKRLFRDMDEKIIAGVCSGLANYFGVNVWIPRIIFVLPFLQLVSHWNHWGMFDFPNFLSVTFSPGATIVYIVLWLILPEAVTAADKLEMKGERVDLNSIKQTIQTDMEGFKGRAEKLGEEMKDKAKAFSKDFSPRAQQFSSEANTVARRASRGLGDIIAFIAKAFAYFILAIVLLVIVCVLFALGVCAFGVSPLTKFVIADGWETFFAWGSLLFFIWVPIVGIITLIIRRIARLKSKSGIMRYSFLALWLLGLFCTISLLVSVKNNFNYKNATTEQNIQLTNAKVDKLEVKLTGFPKSFTLTPFTNLDEDTIFVPNARVKIVKATSDSFQVTVTRLSNGKSKKEALSLAEKIEYNIAQKDSILSFYKGIPINTIEKFRNQSILITIAVPVGKRILIDEKIGWKSNVHIGVTFDNASDNDFDGDSDYYWKTGVEYIMTAKGLQKINADKYNYEDTDSDELEEKKKELEERQNELEDEKRALKESLEHKRKSLEEKRKDLDKILDSTKPYKYQRTVILLNKKSLELQPTQKLENSDTREWPYRLSLLSTVG